MTRVADLEQYVTALVDTPRPGVKGVQAFYEHRIGMICTDPRAMLMPWDDHLVHRGDGVFETMKFVDGKLYQLKPHLDRMKRSCRAIKLDPPCSWSFLEDIVKETAKAGGRKEGMVRIMIGRGPEALDFLRKIVLYPVFTLLFMICIHVLKRTLKKV